MYYQKTFQNEEAPSRTHLSCHAYTGGPDGKVARHCHSYYEISYIVRGKRYEILNDARHEVGDRSVFFIPPLAVHGLNNTTEAEDVVIQFDHQFLQNACDLFDNRYMVKPAKEQGDYFQPEPSGDICRILDSIKQFCHMRDALSAGKNAGSCAGNNSGNNAGNSTIHNENIYFSLNIGSLCLKLVSQMLSEKRIIIDVNGANYSDIITLDPLINQILARPEKRISMKEASRNAGMSYSHFSRLFERITGFNYTVFRNLLRIRRAEELLLSTSMPVSEVGAAVGIDTLSYFTRLFKKINGMAPISYRKKYQAL